MTHSMRATATATSVWRDSLLKVASGIALLFMLGGTTGISFISMADARAVRATQDRFAAMANRAEHCYAKLRTAYEIAVRVNEAERQHL